MDLFGDGLPRTSSDIEPLDGSPSALRSCAEDLRTLAGELSSAWTACHQLGLITDGTSWNGQGFDAFRTKVEKNPKTSDIDNAQTMINAAAGTLDTLATGLDDCQSRITWCRQRIDALALGEGDIPDDVRPQVEAIKTDADSARSDYGRHLTTAGQAFEELTDKTVYAEPPPGFFESVGDFFAGALQITGDFLLGVVEGVWEMVKGLFMIVALVVQPWKWPEAINTLTQIVKFAIENPGEFLSLVGQAIVDWETLKENPAKWLGKLVPNILLAVVTGGAGTAATALTRVAVMASRFSRLTRVADKLNGVARVANRVDNVGRADHLARRVGLLKPMTRRQTFQRIGAMGRLGENLSVQKWTNQGYRPVAQQVTLHSKTTTYSSGRKSGKPVEAIIDHVFSDDASSGTKLFGVESKNGVGADLSSRQATVYPEMETTGVEVRGNKLGGEGYPSGSTLQTDVHVDHWYSPHDSPSVGSQVAVQVGAEGAQQVGNDEPFLPEQPPK
jgi:hypothetical protein